MSASARRSKSTPHLSLSLAPVGQYQSNGLKKQKSAVFDHSFSPTNYVSSSPGTPAVLDREDPFSLSGFFPNPLTERGQHWSWLRVDEGEYSEDEYSEYESELDASLPATPPICDADQVILGEDKLNVLRLSNFLEAIDAKHIVTNIQLMTPYEEEEDVQDSADSLYDTFRARRLASERVEDSTIDCSLYGLFSPVEEKEEPTTGWRNLLSVFW